MGIKWVPPPQLPQAPKTLFVDFDHNVSNACDLIESVYAKVKNDSRLVNYRDGKVIPDTLDDALKLGKLLFALHKLNVCSTNIDINSIVEKIIENKPIKILGTDKYENIISLLTMFVRKLLCHGHGIK